MESGDGSKGPDGECWKDQDNGWWMWYGRCGGVWQMALWRVWERGSNSLQCTSCLKWVHKKCSGISGSLQAASVMYVSKRCASKDDPIVVVLANAGLDIVNGVVLENVGKFCYLGDMINADGGDDSAVVARVQSAWKKFRELSPILTRKGASLLLKGKVYRSCVRSWMIYSSETWAEHEAKLERAEMRMIRMMRRVSLGI